MSTQRRLNYIVYVLLIASLVACGRSETEPKKPAEVQILSPTSTPSRSTNTGLVIDSPATANNPSSAENVSETGTEQQPAQPGQEEYVPPTPVPFIVEGDQKVYEDSFGRFRLAFPEKFTIINSTDAPASIHLMDTTVLEGEGTNAAISVFVQDNAADIEKIASTAIDVFREQSGMNTAQLTVDQKIDFDGLSGIEQVMTYPLAGREMAVRIIYINHPQRTYAVSITTLQDNLAAYAADVEAFLQGMQIQ